MMKTTWFLLLAIFATACNQKKEETSFYGRWTTSFKNGSKVLAVFRKDGTHDYFIDDKLFSSGHFTYSNDTLMEADPICNPDYKATYKISFIAPDSMQFRVIQDTCQPRVYDLDGIKMKRENK